MKADIPHPREVDARGQACPRPVVLTKNALQEIEAGELTVIVDDPVARENVLRFAGSAGCHAEVVEQEGDEFRIRIVKEESSDEAAFASQIAPEGEKTETTVVFINTDRIGQGDEDLGKLLVKAFTFALAEAEKKPQTLVLMNNGVKLAAEGSGVLDSLVQLEKSGTSVMVCGTCLDYYGLKDKVKVGIVSNMYDIAETFLAADKVVTV